MHFRYSNYLTAFTAVLVFAYVAVLSLRGTSIFTDELYNHALVLRSALPSAQHLLESSYLHWYFEAQDIVRPEDWHRSLYLIALVQIHEALPRLAETLIESLNLAMICGYLFVAFMLAREAGRRQDPDPDSTLPACAALLVLVLAPWFPGTAATDYLDDLPSSLVALAAFSLLIFRGFSKPLYGLLIGGIIAFAFAIKDFALIYFPATILACFLIGIAERQISRCILFCVLVSVAFFAGILPKLLWNYAELGMYLPEQARIALNGRMIEAYDGEHQIFVSRPDIEVPHSWRSLVEAQGLAPVFRHGLYMTYAALRECWVLVLLSLPAAAILLWHWWTGRLSRVAMRLVFVVCALTFGMCLFFALQLGEARQFRYWMTLFALCTAMIGGGLLSLASGETMRAKTAALLATLAMLVVVSLGSEGVLKKSGYTLSVKSEKNYPAEVLSALQNIASQGPVLVHTNVGVRFWKSVPAAEIVSVKPGVLMRLKPDEFDDFQDTYPISGAAFHRNHWTRVGYVYMDGLRAPAAEGPVEYLLANGYCIVIEKNDWVVLSAKASCASYSALEQE